MPPLVSIVIPMYRDRAKIGDTVELLANFVQASGWYTELIVVNDGGTDGGVAIVEEKMKKFPFLKLITRPQNRGKGYTVREGMTAATGDYVFFTDADLPYLTDPIKKMLEMMRSGGADFVLANRDLSGKVDQEQPGWPRQITHIIYSHFVRFFIPIPFSDTLAGLKGMRREVARVVLPKLTIDRFSFDVEMLLVAQLAGFKIKELPVSLKNVGRSNLNIRHDAPKMIREILQIWRQYKKGCYRDATAASRQVL